MSRIVYEWVVEKIDPYGDIQDCAYFDESERSKATIFANRWLQEIAKMEGWWVTIGLCRHVVENIGSGDNVILDEAGRSYAYENAAGALPDDFDDGALVPKRFRE